MKKQNGSSPVNVGQENEVAVSNIKGEFASTPMGNAMDGRALYDYQVGELEGRLLTLIETLGLRESQEKATKDMLKGIVRTILYLECTFVIGKYLNEAIQKTNKDMNTNSSNPYK